MDIIPFPPYPFYITVVHWNSINVISSLKALAFRMPYNLWRSLEGGKMSEFGLMAKRHLVTNEDSHGDDVARQYAILFR